MSVVPGSQFGSYLIDGTIGAGGMGEVFRAHDTKLKRDVAIKVLPQAFVEDADRLARFRREAEILASLNHPNITQVYGAFVHADIRCPVLSKVDNVRLWIASIAKLLILPMLGGPQE